MKFTKMQGTGNDYVYINCFNDSVKDPAKLAVAVSHRHFGIGSDGLILIKPTPDAHAEMEMYNADGSVSEMCGNGLRCVAKFVYDHGIAHEPNLRLKTGAGILQAEICATVNNQATEIKLNMGLPILEGLKIPTIWDRNPVIQQPVKVLGREFLATCISMGNPHCVIYVEDVKNFPVHEIGAALEVANYFPNRINVEFVQVISRSEVIQRTWERGAGETWACGTGASAVCVAGVLNHKTDSDLLIHLLGGDLKLSWQPGQNVWLTGGAEEVFSGEWPE
jgi:diaminopimelate epimerase